MRRKDVRLHELQARGAEILMDDSAVTGIRVDECGEPLVDLGLSQRLSFDDRLADKAGLYRYVRVGLAERLSRAAETLPHGLRILVVEGYRPKALQIKYFSEYESTLRLEYPDKTDDELHSLASRFVAPPFDLPPHCTGAAIDLTLVSETGEELDMGTKINDSPEESGGRCYTASKDITEVARSNREILCSALAGAGLVNYPTEWWHWSYGDRYWALKTGATALYGFVVGWP
ncbi:MAG: M15 family metallopeptidase [Acidimicrobiaceae bacterium]|nr:M15 family metallopeptidase [Acidimicrobiaceae bacterium]